MVDQRIMNRSEVDVILGMDLLTTHWVVINCDQMRVITYTHDSIGI